MAAPRTTNIPSFNERKGVYYKLIRVDGKRKYFGLGKDEKKAEEELLELLLKKQRGELDGGKVSSVKEDDSGKCDVAVKELIHLYLNHVEENLSPLTYSKKKDHLRIFYKYFLEPLHPEIFWMSEVTKDRNRGNNPKGKYKTVLGEYYSWARCHRGRSRNGGNEHLKEVKAMVMWGYEEGYCELPRRFPKIRSKGTKKRPLHKPILIKLLGYPALPEDVRDPILFSSINGFRPQETYPFRFSWIDDIHSENPMVEIIYHKTSDMSKVPKPRTVPLKSISIEILKRQMAKHPNSDFVFLNDDGKPYTAQTFRQRVQRWAKKAGIGHIRPYDLRHTFGTMQGKKTNLKTISDVMGHSQISTTVGYMSNNEEYHHDAMQYADDFFMEILAEE